MVSRMASRIVVSRILCVCCECCTKQEPRYEAVVGPMFTSPGRTTRVRETTTGIRDMFVVACFREITCQFWIRAIWAILEHIFVRVYVYMCMCMCTSTCVCVRVHMSTYRHICVHVYVYVCTTPARPACIPLGTRRPSCLRASRGAFRRGPSKAPPPFYIPPPPPTSTHTHKRPLFPEPKRPLFPQPERPLFPALNHSTQTAVDTSNSGDGAAEHATRTPSARPACKYRIVQD